MSINPSGGRKLVDDVRKTFDIQKAEFVKGKYKDEALRLSKLDYLKEIPPAFTGPYYWAAYEVMGNTTPVAGNRRFLLLIIALIAGAGLLLYFLRRRRIFSERSV